MSAETEDMLIAGREIIYDRDYMGNCVAIFDDYDGAPDAGLQPIGIGKTDEEARLELLDDAEFIGNLS